MLRIVLYSHHVRVVSGIQTWEKAFIKSLKPYFDIKFVYRTANALRLEEFEKIVDCIEYNGQEIECDICIYTSTIRKSPKIKAKKYIQIIHADVKTWDSGYTSNGVDLHIAVSNTIKESLKRDFNIDSIVIPNIIETQQQEKVLRFITASRIAQGKGMERMVQMAKAMKENGYRFIWEVYGGGSGQSREYLHNLQNELRDIPEVVFLGPRDSIQSYMSKCDYLVQLSDNEGFCYSIHEALSIGVPVIVTNWQGIEEVVKNGENGYILNMDMSNLDLNRIFTQVPKGYLLTTKDPVKDWLKLLNSYDIEK